MDERLRFVARLLDGEKMAVLCREFDISRKTGYKIFCRYKACGMEGLTDRSRRPYRHANRLPFQIEKLIVQLRKEHPSWGAPKIRENLRRLHTEISLPAISTVHTVLDRHGLVSRGYRKRYKAEGTALEQPKAPNDLWCADYKGEFMLTDRRYCYPLTITDSASRYLLCCDALETTKEAYAFTVFERTFKDFGLPQAIRTDNGIPFVRQVVAILGHHHMGQKPRTCITALNRPGWRVRLHDLLAGTAGILRPHVLDYLPVLGHVLEHLGRILAQRAQRPAALRAVAGSRYRLVHMGLAGQMIRQGLARGLG